MITRHELMRQCASTADTALRLGRFFGMSPQFWLGLQIGYDLDLAEDKLADRIECEVRPCVNTAVKMP